ncbi:hypothetical protein L3X38_005030 [Prunus dulcis]|uniref:Uncharacterized protein n=1 Tax=Prunus dulcis TaxID=3755 RepID=A0AAD4ZQ53_PRUDU|nr:hypothetical protein L3X38_005030 [Prunus dulcis]
MLGILGRMSRRSSCGRGDGVEGLLGVGKVIEEGSGFKEDSQIRLIGKELDGAGEDIGWVCGSTMGGSNGGFDWFGSSEWAS